MYRTSFRSRYARGVLALLVSFCWLRPVDAQVAPGLDPSLILDGPIRSVAPESVPVELARVFLTLESDWTRSEGTASIWAATGPDSVLVLNVADLDVLAVSLPEHDEEPVWDVENGSLTIRIPEGAAENFRVDVSYRVASAFRAIEESGQVMALWTSSLPGRATWMPLPADEITAADYHVSISAPEGWHILVSGNQGVHSFELDGRQISRVESSDIFPRAMGFLAWQPGSDSGLQHGSVGQMLPSMGMDATWLSTVLGLDGTDPMTLLTVGGEMIPAAFPGFGVRSTGRLNREDGWMRAYERLWRDYQIVVTPALGRLSPTDYWIDAAFSAWLAIDHIRREEGDAAAGLVLDELRRRYLSESALYVRPLVWDRWHAASDLRDRHAEAKGAWVFRMLHERLGPEAFGEAMTRFFVAAREEVVDSETLRQELEVVSREDLGSFFDTWVYAAGHPVISLSYQYDPNTEYTNLELKQHQEGQLVPETFVFDAAFQYSTLAETNSITLRVDERERLTQIPTGIAPRFIHPDALATVPLDFATSPAETDLVSQLRYSMDVASTIRSLHLLAGSALDPSMLLGLRSILTSTTDPAVLSEAAPILANMAPSSSALTMLISWTTHEDSRVRAAAVRALLAFPDAPEAFDAALSVANTGKDAHELAAAVGTLVALRPSSAWPILRSALVTESEGDLVRIQALELIHAETADEDDLAAAVLPHLSGSPDVRAAALLCLTRLFPDGPRTTRTAEEWLTAASSIQRAAAIEAIALRELDDIPKSRLESALGQEPDINLRRQILAILSRFEDA